MSGRPKLHSRTRCETLAHRIEKMPTRHRLCEQCFLLYAFTRSESGETGHATQDSVAKTSLFPRTLAVWQ